MKILIVDDKPRLARVTAMALHMLGCHTLTVGTTLAAMNILGAEKIDAVFLDLNLGGENGFTLLSHIVAPPVHPPVIIFTSHTREEVAAEALHRGAFDCLTKPYTLDDLRRQLERIQEYYKPTAGKVAENVGSCSP